MKRNYFRYFLVLLGAAIFLLCFRGYLSQYVMILALALPVLSLLLAIPAALLARVELTAESTGVGKGLQIPLEVKVTGRFPLSVGRIEAVLQVYNTLTGESQQERFGFTLYRGKQALRHNLSSATCGRVICRLKKVRVWDSLGLFPLPVRPLRDRAEVLFYPTARQAYLTTENISMPEGDGDSYSQKKPGDDPSELYGLREYREGDRLSRVHWKLSQKTDQILVKEVGFPVADQILFLLEPDGSPLAVDALMDVFATLSWFLAGQEVVHRAAFRDRETGLLRSLEIVDTEGVIPALETILLSASTKAIGSMEEDELPETATHALYLSCWPERRLVRTMRERMLSSRITVLHVAEKADDSQGKMEGGVDTLAIRPGQIEEALNGLQL